jgi:two-component system chemotaxis sensor kinase CheA
MGMVNNSKSKDPMLNEYIFEMLKLLEELEQICINCERNHTNEEEAINEIFRIVHNIKGSSSMMMFNNISNLAHSIEDLFFFIRENKPDFIDCEEIFNLMFLGIDFIKEEILKIQKGEELEGCNEALLLKSSSILESMKVKNCVKNNDKIDIDSKEDSAYYISEDENPNDEGQEKFVAKIFFKEDCQMENVRAFAIVHELKNIASEIYYVPGDLINNSNRVEYIKKNGFLICFSTAIGEEKVLEKLKKAILIKDIKLEKVEEYPKDIISMKVENVQEVQLDKDSNKNPEYISKIIHEQSTISINTSKLDTLTNLVGEIQVYEAIVTKNPNLTGEQLDHFKKASKQLGKLTKELKTVLLSIRMVPISSTFHSMNRILRDMGKKLNKEVELEIIGEETQVDKIIIDRILEPIMHLVRNSMDHGIELEEERLALGKSKKGKITLEARNSFDNLFIVIKDDGRGLDRKKIYEKAKIKGLVTKEEFELSDSELFSYIFLPGFTVVENVTEYSGRGVGLDIVNKVVQSLGGTIFLESTKGKEFKITIKIPLTLSIINGLEVVIGNNNYIIPINNMREYFKQKKNEVIKDSDGRKKIMIRGETYPIYDLRRLFNIKSKKTPYTEGVIVIVKENLKVGGLFVDSIIGERKVLVKSIPKHVQRTKILIGCTILEDGEISLVLDIYAILNL